MKYITIGAAATVIEFSNGTIIDNPNKITLPHIGSNYLLYISKSCHFGVIVHDAAKWNVCKQYIHYDTWVIPIYFNKALIYIPIWESNQWMLDKLTNYMLVSD